MESLGAHKATSSVAQRLAASGEPRDTEPMLARLLSLIAALALACGSTNTHANARLPQPETAHRAFATIAETASRAEALLIASDIKANCHRQRECTTAHDVYANNSPYKFKDPDGRDADRAYGAAVGLMMGDDPEKMRIWAGGEAAATTEGSGAEMGAAMGMAVGEFVRNGDYSKEAVAGVAVKAMVMAVTKGKIREFKPGAKFTPAQKRDILAANRDRNGGELKSDKSGGALVPSEKSRSGVTPSPQEAQVDHKVPRSAGGTNDPANAQVLSRKENRDKSDTVE